MKLVSVAGQINSGKDVFSDKLVNQCNALAFQGFMVDFNIGKGYQLWTKVAFGDGLKKIMMDAFGVNLDFIEEWKRRPDVPPDYLMTIREALQFIGDNFRKIKPTVWVDLALNKFPPEMSSDGVLPPLVVSDVRYLNEARAVKDRGGISILLWRPGYENDTNHPSEAQLKPYIEYCSKYSKEGKIEFPYYVPSNLWSLENGPKPDDLFDIFIINDGTLEQLYDKIKNIVIPILKNRFNFWEKKDA